jgi:hypothetical protein
VILIDVVKAARSVTLGAISSTTPHADRCHLTNDDIRSHNGAADLRQGAILGHNPPEARSQRKEKAPRPLWSADARRKEALQLRSGFIRLLCEVE